MIFRILFALFAITSLNLKAHAAGVSQFRYDAQVVISAGDMSTSAINGTPIDLDQYQGFMCQAVFTGSPVGTLKLQISGDIVSSCASVTNWVDYTGSSTSISAAGNFLWNATASNFRCVRVVYTKTSGTGALNAICGKKL